MSEPIPTPAFPLKILVIGAGPMATHVHLPVLAGLRDRGRVDLALLCDLDRSRAGTAAAAFGFRASTGDAHAAMARDDIDAVYIFASAQLHYEYGMLALGQGKHLFVEKPVAPSAAQAQALADLARDRGLVAVGGHNRRFYPSLRATRERAGRAGWRQAEAVFHKPMAGQPPGFGAASWLSGNGIHALDALLWMMDGPPEHLAAHASDQTFSALMRWPGDRQAVFLCDNAAGTRREDYAFNAAGESCAVTEASLTVQTDGRPATTAFPSGMTSFILEHDAFLDAVRTGRPAPHDLTALVPALHLCELIERGHVGPVAPPVATPPPAPAQPTQGTILVAGQWGAALAPLLPGYRLAALDDITAVRPDVVAALLGRGATALDPARLDHLPNLAVVGVAGLSVARFGAADLLARGVALVNASAAHADSVAEFALALAILGRRRAFHGHAVMRAGGWGVIPGPQGLRGLAMRLKPVLRRLGLLPLAQRVKDRMASGGAPRPAQSRDLAGATVGLVGWGDNARAFARRLATCDARVLVWSRNGSDGDIRQAGAQPAALDQVLAADIVSLHRGLTPATRHTLGAAELARLRPGAVLINVARGGLIEPAALLDRLRRGDVFACLDTYEEEPLPPRHPLRRLPNVFLTPHIAGGSVDMQAAATAEVVAKVCRLLEGGSADTLTAARLRGMS
ncbi:NAD(P)-dependent oxidoreductase [Nitrospirillum iridis]|uniref:Phosphoglycerate dehydrogenase-like enzyme/predicted dehydrogenase n=1 Tax=Nitrospirillum iridis TaxID=765888 RepID=A0A7X0B2J0_9PROT|nr:NAD(P)-dependent oxidoreductase [Nitrospirillum iridis]MBB6254192.1 phosphoglycerate dehydrogenase-like enzyme/predicted dehydrogenase [Nitrospirillum iridis]